MSLLWEMKREAGGYSVISQHTLVLQNEEGGCRASKSQEQSPQSIKRAFVVAASVH